MRVNGIILLAVLCMLGVGLFISIAGCSGSVTPGKNASNEQTMINISTISTPLPEKTLPEKICYETDLTENCSVHAPFCHPVLWEGYYQPGDYFVHIDPIADHKVGEVFQITGCTNVPKETIFEGSLVQTEYFTPAGVQDIPSTVKNISLMPGCNDTIQYFSYEVNSTDFEYTRYDVFITSIFNPYEHTGVMDSRSFNITNHPKITCPAENPPHEDLKKLVKHVTHTSDSPREEILPKYFTYDENGCTSTLHQCSWFYVLLPENPSTGYQWNLSVSEGLEIGDSKYIASDNPTGLDGMGGMHVWVIRAAEREYMTVTGVYTQPWRDATVDDQMYSLVIPVHPKADQD